MLTSRALNRSCGAPPEPSFCQANRGGLRLRALMVMTSSGQAPDTGQRTGLWLEEFTAAYYVFLDAGVEVVLASPCGGMPPIDPASDRSADHGGADHGTSVARFKRDTAARLELSDTLTLEQIVAEDFSCAFYCGGPGALWDFPDDVCSIGIVRAFAASAKPLGMVSHAPAALCGIADEAGLSLVAGRRLTSISRSEQSALGTGVLSPFCLEQQLRELGALYGRGPARRSHIVRDGFLVTGQNARSARGVARALLAQVV
jgi:putative intracellular protease/amidase